MLVYELFVMKLFLVIIISFYFSAINADDFGSATGLELPRYVSLKSDESNLRVGPSKNYPILIKYIVDNYPLKIIEEYKDWRKIIDLNNNSGWVHKSIIKSERYGITSNNDDKNIYIHNTKAGKIIGEINSNLVVYLSKCKIDWCLVSRDNHKGWIKKEFIWGVKKNEVFNIRFFQIFIDYYFKSLNYLEEYFSK